MSSFAVDRVLAAAGVRFAYLFGSRAAGRHRATSDADIAIMPEQPLDMLAESSLADQLAQALRVPAVDLLDLRRAPLRMRGRVLEEGQLLYSADEPSRVAFEVRTRSEYFDFLPTQRAHRDHCLRRVAAGGWMVDLDRVHERLELLSGYLRELQYLRDLPIAEYLRDHMYAGRYLVQVAAQTCIDLANHIIASEGWRAPRDFGDSFTVLYEHDVINEALAGRLRGLAGLRNRLVHVYDEIDDVRVHEALVTGLPA